jgi:hypothetical protein
MPVRETDAAPSPSQGPYVQPSLSLPQVFPAIYAYHQYLHITRGQSNGLVYSYHPWESELPTDSPFWTTVLAVSDPLLDTQVTRGRLIMIII